MQLACERAASYETGARREGAREDRGGNFIMLGGLLNCRWFLFV